jgi:hypothetical protein
VRIFACTGIVNCDDVKNKAEDPGDTQCEELFPTSLGDIVNTAADDQILQALEVNNAQCSLAFARFVDPETLCNKVCIVSGGRIYCF